MKPELELQQLLLAIENMYDQLDSDQINSWPVAGLEITVDGHTYTLEIK